MEYYTATSGFSYGFGDSITTKDIVHIIDDLHKMFPVGYKFTPERILEGGILFEEFPGKTEKMYKTFRFQIQSPCIGKWPWIEDGILDLWRKQDPVIIWKNPSKKISLNCSSYLKAYDGAPLWTNEELDKFKDAFANVGVRCQKAKVTKLKTPKH